MKCFILLFIAFLPERASSLPSPGAAWWQDPNLRRHLVDPDFDWSQRDMGIEEGGEAYFEELSHYNRTELSTRPLVPWTKGRLWKETQAVTPSSFEVRRLFEESAIGHWSGGKEALKNRGENYEETTTFHKTPFRVTRLPVRLPNHWPVEAGTSRVTLCGKGTVSGPRWLPNDFEQSAELLQGGDYKRLEFSELFLTLDDSRKIGLFLEYDGCTGELQQMFLMRQIRVPPDHDFSSLDAAQKYLESRQLWPILPPDNAASKAFRQHPNIEDGFIEKRHWRGRRGVCIHLDSPAGSSVRLETNDIQSYHRPIPPDEREIYYDERFDDGVFCRFPKTFHPTHLAEDVCIELGCVTEHGLQRILVCGKRSRGGLDTCIYEEWS